MSVIRSVEDPRQGGLEPHNLKLLHSNRFEIPQIGAVGHVKGHRKVRSGVNT
jgi:hypothetical protein